MNDWKAAYDAAKLHVQVLEESRKKILEYALKMREERDVARAEHADVMASPRWIV